MCADLIGFIVSLNAHINREISQPDPIIGMQDMSMNLQQAGLLTTGNRFLH